jgi:hypothetical protein
MNQIHEPEFWVRQIIKLDQIQKLTGKEREGEND